MNIRQKIDKEFDRQAKRLSTIKSFSIERYVKIAEGYAVIENVLAVLSNLNRKESVVFHGKFSQILDINPKECSGLIPSIWEDEIFKIIHPEDLEMKLFQELLFFHYINRLPQKRKFNQCLMQRLRMRSKSGEWVEVLHRLYYMPDSDNKSAGFALCLYGAMTTQFNGSSAVIDTMTGQISVLDSSTGCKILSRQEVAVLKLIDSGNRSRGIADILNISIHTVSRHRQNIIAKLKVRNSVEACKIARSLAIL